MYRAWTHEEWLIAFQKIQPTPEAGRLAYEAARYAAEASPWPNWQIKTDYYNHLVSGRPVLTQQQLAAGVTTALSYNLPFSFILEHAPSYI